MKITITGRIPSKKNQKQMVCRGNRPILLPSKKHEEWHDEAMWQLKAQKVPQDKLENVSMVVQFFAPDKRRADASNKLESINDLLVDYGLLKDDDWWTINRIIILKTELDRENPRVELEIC